MHAVLSGRAGWQVVALHGELVATEAPGLHALLTRLVLEGPDGVVCDLSAVTGIDDPCIGVIADMPSWGYPAGRVITFCGAQGQVAAQLEVFEVGRIVPLYATLAEAAAAPARPPVLTARVTLSADPVAPHRARRFVRQTCQRWQHLALADDAELVASELVANVVQHADCLAELHLELSQSALYIRVRDFADSPVRLREAATDSEDGRGLRIVSALSRAWNSYQHPDGGKIVWAALAWPVGAEETS